MEAIKTKKSEVVISPENFWCIHNPGKEDGIMIYAVNWKHIYAKDKKQVAKIAKQFGGSFSGGKNPDNLHFASADIYKTVKDIQLLTNKLVSKGV